MKIVIKRTALCAEQVIKLDLKALRIKSDQFKKKLLLTKTKAYAFIILESMSFFKGNFYL